MKTFHLSCCAKTVFSNRIDLKRTINILCLLIFGNLGIYVGASAQHTVTNPPFRPQPSPQGPTSGALSKYGDYQVSLFTGVPEISIPLYEIKSGNLSVPI